MMRTCAQSRLLGHRQPPTQVSRTAPPPTRCGFGWAGGPSRGESVLHRSPARSELLSRRSAGPVASENERSTIGPVVADAQNRRFDPSGGLGRADSGAPRPAARRRCRGTARTPKGPAHDSPPSTPPARARVARPPRASICQRARQGKGGNRPPPPRCACAPMGEVGGWGGPTPSGPHAAGSSRHPPPSTKVVRPRGCAPSQSVHPPTRAPGDGGEPPTATQVRLRTNG